jgi:hypothetical protein
MRTFGVFLFSASRPGSPSRRSAAMRHEIRIDAPTADDAHALMSRLPGYRTVVERSEHGWELRIEREHGVNELLRDVLGCLDEWLVARGLEDTNVTLENGKTYVVAAPPPRPPQLPLSGCQPGRPAPGAA